MKTIAIIGATGALGQPVTHTFIQAGYKVSLLVREAGKARKMFGSGIRIVEGNLQKSDCVQELLLGQENLYLNLSVKQTSNPSDFQPEREGLKTILEQAKMASVRRIGYLSSLVQRYQGHNGFRWWVFDIKLQAVEAIKQSGISYSIFYPSTFMESFSTCGYRQGNMINLSGDSLHPMYLIAGSDYGKQVVNAFERNTSNHEYVVQGPEAYTADEAAKLYASRYTRSKIRVLKMPFGLLKFLGRFGNKLNYGTYIVEALNKYPEKFEAMQTWQELGKPGTTFAEFIRKG